MRMVLVVAKEPRPGFVKTRLGATLGHERAAALYRAFSADTFRLAQTLGSQLLIAHWPAEAHDHFARELGAAAHLAAQVGADFGERLHSAFVSGAAVGGTALVLIGTDSPSLPAALVQAAFERLDDPSIDAVLGPCEDGGWYLLGLRQPNAAVFSAVEWSSDQTCAQTCERIAQAGLRLHVLPAWYDVDTAADLPRLHADLAARPDAAASATLPLLAAVLAEQG